MKEQIQFLLLKIYIRLGIISPKRMTVAQLALATLKRIPKNMWVTSSFHIYDKACALGWMNNFFGNDNEGTDKGNGGNIPLAAVSRAFLRNKYHLLTESIADVNDINCINNYIEQHSKDRVVHMCKDMVKEGY